MNSVSFCQRIGNVRRRRVDVRQLGHGSESGCECASTRSTCCNLNASFGEMRGVKWKAIEGRVTLSHSRQVYVCRTTWITFHSRGTTSRLSVECYPSFESSFDPQRTQCWGETRIPASRRSILRGWQQQITMDYCNRVIRRAN